MKSADGFGHAVILADEALLLDMDDKAAEQLCNVATLPGIVAAAHKDVEAVVRAAEAPGLACRVAWLEPLVCIKG